MDTKHRRILQIHHKYLVDNMNIEGLLLDYLLEKSILSSSDLEKLKARITMKDKIRYLIVDILPRRGPDAYPCFIEALKKDRQQYIAEKLEESVEDKPVSQAKIGQGRSQNSCLIGYVHQVQGRRTARSGSDFFSFHLQIGPDQFERCLSFAPDEHENKLRLFQEKQEAVCLAKFNYREPSEGYNELPTIMLNKYSLVLPIDAKGVKIGFGYKEMPEERTFLDQLSNLNPGMFINVRVRVICQHDREKKAVKRKLDTEVMEFQEKIVMDEKGNIAVLSVWKTPVDDITPEKGWIDIHYVSVKEFKHSRHLSTNINTTFN